MNPAHIHLLFVHVPVLGAYFGLLLFLFGWLFKNEEAVWISLGVFVLVGIAATVVFLTGEGAEEAVEGIAGVTRSTIHTHEDMAQVAMIVSIVLGITGLVGLVVARRTHVAPSWLKLSVLVFGLVAGGVLARTAYLGGQINHPEIRPGHTVQQDAAQEGGEADPD